MYLYALGKGLAGLYFKTLFRFRVEGLENIPAEGGAIICGNHFTLVDPAVVGVAMPRRVAFMGKQEAFKNPIIGWVLRGLGSFPVKRGTPDRAALKHSLELMEKGYCFGIFPEGTRSRTGKLGRPEPGAAYLALKSSVPVIPVGITSRYKLFGPILVRFGRPIDLEPYRAGKLTGDVLEAASEVIMAGIGAQLEPPVSVSVAAGKEQP